MNKILHVLALLLLIACTGSKKNFAEIERFIDNEEEFNKILKILEDRYINMDQGKDLARKTILICEGASRFNREYYRICDDQKCLRNFQKRWEVL